MRFTTELRNCKFLRQTEVGKDLLFIGLDLASELPTFKSQKIVKRTVFYTLIGMRVAPSTSAKCGVEAQPPDSRRAGPQGVQRQASYIAAASPALPRSTRCAAHQLLHTPHQRTRAEQ